jgi:peptide deformylase
VGSDGNAFVWRQLCDILLSKVNNLGPVGSNLRELLFFSCLEIMAKLTILEFPDPRLRTKAQPVESVDNELRMLVDDMFETMYAAPGIGLAATQVNVHQRLLVADVSSNGDAPHVLINPVILEKDGVQFSEEGCLSVPGYFEEVERAEHIKVRYLDRNGEEVEQEMEGLLAVCVQHEIDHLDGKLFVDYISEAKRSRIRKRLMRDQRQRAPAVM